MASVLGGEVVALVGLNGTGKTTLLKRLAEKIAATSSGAATGAMYYSPSRAAEMSDDLLVADYYSLAYSLHNCGRLSWWNRRARLERVMAALPEYIDRNKFEQIAWKRVSELSSGERQRLILADLLLSREAILLLDEPAAHFDIGFEAELWRILKTRSKETGGGCVVVSHNIGLARKSADRLYVARVVTNGNQRIARIAEDRFPPDGADLAKWLRDELCEE
jgi:ABC-type cobalamin/Fe3+-siderophores transport system ATPase subunit